MSYLRIILISAILAGCSAGPVRYQPETPVHHVPGQPAPKQDDKPTARLFLCDPSRRPNHPQGNKLETDKAKVIINESFCRIT